MFPDPDEIFEQEPLPTFIVFGTHQFQWMLEPFSFLFWKYWGNDSKIIYFSDKKDGDVPFNVEFRQVPLSGEWNWLKDFGNGVAQSLATLADEIVMISLLDMWPIRAIHLDRVKKLKMYVSHSSTQVLRVLVGDDMNLLGKGKCVDHWYGLELMSCDRKDLNIGLFSGWLLAPSLWNRQLMISSLVNCSFWDFEHLHTGRMSGNSPMATWCRQSIYPYMHTMSRDDQGKIHIMWAEEGDRALIKSLVPGWVRIVEHSGNN